MGSQRVVERDRVTFTFTEMAGAQAEWWKGHGVLEGPWCARVSQGVGGSTGQAVKHSHVFRTLLRPHT